MLRLPDQNALLFGNAQDDVQQRLDSIRLQQRLQGAPDAKQEAKLRESSQDFEAMFLHQMLKQMRATVPKEGMLNSKDEEFWQSHFDMEMATVMARNGGIGLGDIIFDQLRQTQVQASQSSDPAGKPMGMTILPPVEANPSTGSDTTAPEFNSTVENSESAMVARDASQENTGQGPYGTSEMAIPRSAPLLPGNTTIMGMVRSLARSIEERGGIVPEHPGITQGTEPVQEIHSQVSLPPMHWPLQGRVSSNFGWRNDPFTREQAWHAGTDLVAPRGTPINAAWDGRVVFAGERGGYGNMVVLEHTGGWRSYYAHNDQNAVKVGDSIQAGQKIATVGSTGRSTGPHLHFEIRQGNIAWDPRQIQDRLQAGLSIGRKDADDSA